MTFKVGSYSLFHTSQKMKKNMPFSSVKTDKKALTSVNQASKKNSTTWYVRGIDLFPTQENRCLPVPAKLSPDRVNVISVALQETPKNTPIPLPRSNITHLSSASRHSKIDKTEEVYKPDPLTAISTKNKTPPEPLPRSNDKQKTAFQVDLSDVISVKNVLKPTDKKIPPELNLTSKCSHIEKNPVKNTSPLFSPQKNTIESVPVTVSTSLQKKVSFRTEAATTQDPETSSSETSTTSMKSILKKTSSLNNKEEELKLALDELNEVLKDLGIDPL